MPSSDGAGARYNSFVNPRICAAVVLLFTLSGGGLAQEPKFLGRSVVITTPRTKEG
jgi:hypothetical protein